MKKLSLVAAVVAVLATPLTALAESDVNTAAGPNSTATARLDFTVVIPRVLFLQVGTGTNLTDLGTIDSLTFTVPAASLGDGTDIAGTGGDLTAGAVRVRVFGNNGNIGLTATSPGALTSGTDTIPWSEILVTPTAPTVATSGYTAAVIAHPAIPTAAGVGAATTITATNKVVREEGIWTFKYDNTVAYAAGSYGATGGTNGRLVYTATMP
ncbi:MAG: hypothetical protein JWQ13_1159 [Ramlibacter sp.]|jgi:hypothetical protein|nr:hypothetical protein [Ramlibacter sp.]